MLTLENARQWYSANDEVHGFSHIERVYRLCEKIGSKEGADMKILLSAALLHDARGCDATQGERNIHHLRSAEFAAQVLGGLGWSEKDIRAVQHCIRTHRYRKQDMPETLEAKVLSDADHLDAIGAVGILRALAFAFQSGMPAFTSPSPYFLENFETQPGEAHSAYHEYLFKLKHISAHLFTTTAREIAEGRQALLNRFFEQLAAEMQGH